ncbi:exodeoxyribonuclease VII large subunit [Olivibacter domesticus]|uniref:Exodeoxyribonuclease 7 large subunit n=1 Tax=Olivibacter domesticus TaxID=407022 RepID=A0A1H7VTB8_OLID1|nr:exodeoxyribonuclease VII large subunit [Olivibacter domesticus]SEM12592.1 exodeoxyribonuclease VII large subunit [Olivibacter domesticus]
MPQTITDKTIFSLAEVARSIQKTIADRYKSLYWIKAEMNKLNHYSHSGHCYPELLEKKDGKVIAEIRSTLWKGDYERINQRFMEVTKEPLKNGINILMQASINYDPVHGLSLHILDIDASYSLGELEREKQASIVILKEQGIFDANKQLIFPVLPKRLAIISVETSKGLADFLKIIDNNPYGYHFEHRLFPALLQGEKSVPSIIDQLKQVRLSLHDFDVVAIIRGGGGDVGLSSYNNVLLATAIATFPIPVITGIGHATNETVSEMVAYKNAITPSALADYLLQHFHDFARPVAYAEQVLRSKTTQLFEKQHQLLNNTIKYFRMVSINELQENRHQLASLRSRTLQQSKQVLIQEKNSFKQLKDLLSAQSKHILMEEKQNITFLGQRLKRENIHLNKHSRQILVQVKVQLIRQVHHIASKERAQLNELQNSLALHGNKSIQEATKKIESQERHLSILDPQHVLKRGYSITLLEGKAIKNANMLKEGDKVKTILALGEIESEITFVKGNNKTEKYE